MEYAINRFHESYSEQKILTCILLNLSITYRRIIMKIPKSHPISAITISVRGKNVIQHNQTIEIRNEMDFYINKQKLLMFGRQSLY